MIPSPGPRAPYPGTSGFHHAPNAALLIDFDNVTMGIRSDLGKELKALLNSEVIRGKVAVQRAYADWRRYPQYIVPLAESSIDLIFAPAYGSAKKNATDLRMAIDAIELVFIRPEIGTFILMTGDSDFSSCVLKLKEYGKYVIGVGMRESSSDLLIQNCDEYYSYHSLSGLTRAGEVEDSKEDPWVLVKRAAQQMETNGDVMRTDRLKQVMLDLDPAFDEKKIGYSKFSRFVQEAATKGVVRLRKGENGQYELVSGEGDAEGEPAAPSESRGRGRGRDSRRDGRRDARPPRAEGVEERPREEVPREQAAPTPEPVAAELVPEPVAPAARAAEQRGTPVVAEDGTGIDQAYSLLQAAVRELTGDGGRSVRDGDVKRKMLDISPGFDEADLGFSKFTRFLRQAHDAEVIDLQRANGGNYEVALPASGKRLPAPSAGAARPRREAPPEAAVAPPVGRQRPLREEAPVAATVTPEAPRPAERPAVAATAAATPVAVSAPAAAPAPAPRGATGVGALRGRRGGRPGAAEGPPPILPGQGVASSPRALEAEREVETIPAGAGAPAVPAAEAGTGAAAAAAEAAEEPRRKSRRGRRGRGKGRAAEGDFEVTQPETQPVAAAEAAATEVPAAAPRTTPAPPEGPIDKFTARARRGRAARAEAAAEVTAAPPPPTAPPVEKAPAKPGRTRAPAKAAKAAAAAPGEAAARGRGRGRAAATAPAKTATPAATAADAALASLPRDRMGVTEYLTTSYGGVGQKTAEALFDSFGEKTFEILRSEPDRVRELLGRRAANLLDQWTTDYERRVADAAPAADADRAAKKPAKPGGGRGGRGRKKKEPASAS
jgi:uncharacterized protein (TIGR00288 family)